MSHPPLRVAASRGFFKALKALPERGRAKVHKFIVQFMDEPTGTGLNYERINGSRDPHQGQNQQHCLKRLSQRCLDLASCRPSRL